MARIRTIKPELWNDEKLANEGECVMLTFIGMLNFSDDYGVIKANPMWLKNQIYPYKDKLRLEVFITWLTNLEKLEVVIPFTCRGESFYYIRTFRKHQRVDKPSKTRNVREDILIATLTGIGYTIQPDGDCIKHSPSIRRVFAEGSAPEVVSSNSKGKGIEANASVENDGQDIYKRLVKDKKTINDFIHAHKPDFIEPYYDLWNLFAAKTGLPAVISLNDKRKRKFKTRIREEKFDFREILRKANASETLLTKGWFSFDWVIENGTNYLKVLEGNYDNARKTEQKQPAEQILSKKDEQKIFG